MSQPRLVHVSSIAELRDHASMWDDLWCRSEVTMPTARAELLAQWVEWFAPEADFHTLVVEDQGTWVAALPLLRVNVKRVFSAAVSPGAIQDRTWIPGGGFLLDTNVDPDAAVDTLIRGVRELPWRLLWRLRLDHVALDAPRWKMFRRALGRAGMASNIEGEYQVGIGGIDHDWEACKARWPSKHRYNMGRGARTLGEGGARFEMYSQIEPDEVEQWMRRGFEVEHRSWKGQARTSIFARGEFPFFVRQAKQLASWKQLELTFIEHNNHPIAFSYGFNAKGVHQVYKIAYDPGSEYASFSPGKLVWYHIFQQLQGDPESQALDFLGPMTEALSRWRPTTYRVGNLIIAPQTLLGHLVWHARSH